MLLNGQALKQKKQEIVNFMKKKFDRIDSWSMLPKYAKRQNQKVTYNSNTGNWTRATWVRARYPNH